MMAVLYKTHKKMFMAVGLVPLAILIATFVAWRSLPARSEAALIPESWSGEYFSFRPVPGVDTNSGSSTEAKPLLARNDQEIDFDWGNGSPDPAVPPDQFSVHWARTARLSEGSYRFHAKVDDGIRLWVDDALLMDRWYDNRGKEQTADVVLVSGDHNLRVEYFENYGTAAIKVWWEKLAAEEVAAPPIVTPGQPIAQGGANAAQPASQPAAQPASQPASQPPALPASPVTSATAEPRQSTPLPAGNVITNPSFELDTNGDSIPDGWTVSVPDSEFRLDGSVPGIPDGKMAVSFPPNSKSYTVTQEVPAAQYESYEFSGQVNVPSAGGWYRLSLTVVPLNDRGQPLATYDQASFSQTTSGWVQVKKRMTMPTYTVKARIQAKVDVMRGSAYLDDLRLELASR